MDLYLVRHAIAEERRVGLPDAERALTDTGRKRFTRVVERIDAMGVRFDLTLHSPWRRAAQTARMLQSLSDGPLQALEALADEPGPDLLQAIHGSAVALVGHEPWLSELLVWLISGRTDMPVGLDFKKGGIAWLRGEPTPGGMALRALLPPRTMGAT